MCRNLVSGDELRRGDFADIADWISRASNCRKEASEECLSVIADLARGQGLARLCRSVGADTSIERDRNDAVAFADRAVVSLQRQRDPLEAGAVGRDQPRCEVLAVYRGHVRPDTSTNGLPALSLSS